MCEHLSPLENFLKLRCIRETFRGAPWTENCREWVYFDCALDLTALRSKFHLPAFVEDCINNDERSGLEAGFCCSLCNDAIMGLHPSLANDKITVR